MVCAAQSSERAARAETHRLAGWRGSCWLLWARLFLETCEFADEEPFGRL